MDVAVFGEVGGRGLAENSTGLKNVAVCPAGVDPLFHLVAGHGFVAPAARERNLLADLNAAALFLSEIIASTPDPAAKAQYQGALDEIEVERNARILDRARAVYRERHGRDIADVWDLVVEMPAIVSELPSAVPSSLPESLRRGAQWEIDEKSGRIVSSHYGRRYELSVPKLDQERNLEWKRRREQAAQRREASGV